jgi:hypothetical protein
LFGERGQDPIQRLHEHDPGLGRIDGPEIAAQRVAGDLAQRAGQLGAGGPAAHDHERHPLRSPGRDRLALGGLERDQDPPSDLDRILDRLQPRRMGCPRVMAEVGMTGAGGHDQGVVADRAAVREHDPPGVRLDRDRLAEQHRGVPLATQDRTQRLRDLTW